MRRCFVLLILGLFIAAVPAAAQEPERIRQLVYHVNAFEGQAWEGVFYPQSEETIYLLAGHDNTISPRETMVYFWTITQRFLPDWAELDEPVAATMEIRRGNRLLQTLALSDYLLQGARSETDEALQLFTGAEAHQRFREYQEALDDYWVALEEYTEKRTVGEAGDAPRAPSLFSTRVLQGFIVNLEEGSYEMRLIDGNGRLIPGSEKRLWVFSHRRTGLTYELIPERRWTVREQSDTPDETIYVSSHNRLFLQPYRAQEFNAYLYGKLLDPQAPPADERAWRWAPQQPIAGATLHLRDRSRETHISRDAFVVEQSSRSSLGYTINSLNADSRERPAFMAYEVSPTLEPGDSLQIWLVDGAGHELPGSRRTILGVRPLASNELLLPALIPFAFGLLLALRRLFARE